MTVHIQELHTDVQPLRPGSTEPTPPDPPWAALTRWCADRERAEWLRRRTCAVDFDD